MEEMYTDSASAKENTILKTTYHNLYTLEKANSLAYHIIK